MIDQLTNDIWALLLSGTGEPQTWKISDVELNNGWSFHVKGCKYVGRIKITVKSVRDDIHVTFVSDDNPTERISLACVTTNDMLRAQKEKGASIPREALERFKNEYGFL